MELTEKYLTESPLRYTVKDIKRALEVFDFIANEAHGENTEFLIKVFGSYSGKDGAFQMKFYEGMTGKMNHAKTVKELSNFI